MEPEDITHIPALYQGIIDGMRQATRQKWYEAGTAFFARAMVNKDVAIACGEAGFSEAMVFFCNKAAWLPAQGLACFAESAKVQ